MKERLKLIFLIIFCATSLVSCVDYFTITNETIWNNMGEFTCREILGSSYSKYVNSDQSGFCTKKDGKDYLVYCYSNTDKASETACSRYSGSDPQCFDSHCSEGVITNSYGVCCIDKSVWDERNSKAMAPFLIMIPAIIAAVVIGGGSLVCIGLLIVIGMAAAIGMFAFKMNLAKKANGGKVAPIHIY